MSLDNSTNLGNALKNAHKAMANKNYDYEQVASMVTNSIKVALKDIKTLGNTTEQNKTIKQIKTDLTALAWDNYHLAIDNYNPQSGLREAGIYCANQTLPFTAMLIFFGKKLISEFGENKFTNSINIECHEKALMIVNDLYNSTNQRFSYLDYPDVLQGYEDEFKKIKINPSYNRKKWLQETEKKSVTVLNPYVTIPNPFWSDLAICSFLFGLFGIDRFMAGKWFTAILKISVFIAIYVFYANIPHYLIFISIVWWLIDFILILLGRFRDAEGNLIGRYIEITREEYEKQIAEKERQVAEKQAERQRKIEEKQRIANAEYRRQCRACGQIWHSSIAQENVGSGSLVNTAVALVAASRGNLTAALIANNRAEEKEAARENYLHSVRRCPHCGSSSYNEEIVSYV